MWDGSHSDSRGCGNRGGVALITVPLRPQIGLGLSGSGLLLHRTFTAPRRRSWTVWTAAMLSSESALATHFHKLVPTEVAEEHQVLIP
jgi:hypothetical protein